MSHTAFIITTFLALSALPSSSMADESTTLTPTRRNITSFTKFHLTTPRQLSTESEYEDTISWTKPTPPATVANENNTSQFQFIVPVEENITDYTTFYSPLPTSTHKKNDNSTFSFILSSATHGNSVTNDTELLPAKRKWRNKGWSFDDEDGHNRSQLQRVISTVLEAPLVILAPVGNVLTIVAVWRCPRLRTVANMYVVSLAVADFLVGVILPWKILLVHDEGYVLNPYQEDTCLMLNCCFFTLMAASMLTITDISLDRFLHVRFPIHYPRYVTPRNAGCILAGTWLLAILLGAVPVIQFASQTSVRDEHVKCHVYFMQYEYRTYQLVGQGGVFAVCSLVSGACYSYICLTALRHKRDIAKIVPVCQLGHFSKEPSPDAVAGIWVKSVIEKSMENDTEQEMDINAQQSSGDYSDDQKNLDFAHIRHKTSSNLIEVDQMNQELPSQKVLISSFSMQLAHLPKATGRFDRDAEFVLVSEANIMSTSDATDTTDVLRRELSNELSIHGDSSPHPKLTEKPVHENLICKLTSTKENVDESNDISVTDMDGGISQCFRDKRNDRSEVLQSSAAAVPGVTSVSSVCTEFSSAEYRPHTGERLSQVSMKLDDSWHTEHHDILDSTSESGSNTATPEQDKNKHTKGRRQVGDSPAPNKTVTTTAASSHSPKHTTRHVDEHTISSLSAVFNDEPSTSKGKSSLPSASLHLQTLEPGSPECHRKTLNHNKIKPHGQRSPPSRETISVSIYFMIFALFFVLWSPTFLVLMLGLHAEGKLVWLKVLFPIGLLNSVSNVLVYAWKCEEMRSSLKNILLNCFCRKSSSVSPTQCQSPA